MKIQASLFGLFVLFSLLFIHENSRCQSTDLEQARIAFSELKATLDKESGKLWNHTLNGPLMIANRDTRIVIANEADENGKLEKKGDLFVGLLPDNLNIANTASEWDGKLWTMVAFPLPDNKEERLNLLIHESFHRIQPEIGFGNIQFISCSHLDELEGRVYLKMELEALKMALITNDGSIQKEHLMNALLFRRYRHSLYKMAKENENYSELKEGLAEYTGSILSGRSDNDLKLHYIEFIESLYKNSTFVSSFAYRTIPVYGYFIYQEDKDWNKQIKISTNLTDYLDSYFNIPSAIDISNTINSIQTQYNYDSVLLFEKEREQYKIGLTVKYDSIFQLSPTLTIPLQNMQIGYSPANLTPYKDKGTIYPNCRITDNWGILTVDSSALVGKNWDSVTVSEPIKITKGTVSGKGWNLELNKGWELKKISSNYILFKK